MQELTYENYREILEYEYAEEEKQSKTFLQIARQPHYENVISNILAFFFDTEEEHGLKDLFLSSLVQLINERKNAPPFSMHNCTAEREVGDGGTGRIDILLKDELGEKFIFIENKIYHFLSNDLESYYQSVSVEKAEKVGVLLTSESMPTGHEHFVNITHLQLAEKVLANLGKYYLSASDKYLYLLKDYIQNINLFYLSDSMNNKLKFYYQHHQKINEMAMLQNEVVNYVKDEVKKAAEKFGYHFTGGRGNNYLYWVFLEAGHTLYEKFYYSIHLTELNKHQAPSLAISLTFDHIGDDNIQAALDADLKSKSPDIHFIDSFPNYQWIDFAWKTYEMTEENMLNLAGYLYEYTKQDFETVKNELLAILTQTTK